MPGDRARWHADGQIELLGRDSVTINSGGEKIFAEEAEAANAEHPAVYEVVAVVQLVDGERADSADIIAEAARHIARYKLPKAIVFCDRVRRSPSGKADYTGGRKPEWRELFERLVVSVTVIAGRGAAPRRDWCGN